MKKWIIVAAFASAILAGCTKNEVRVNVPDRAITFQTVVGKNSTKALMDGTAYDTNISFGTIAWYLEDGQTWADNHADAKMYIGANDALDEGALGEEVSYTVNDEGNCWTTETPYYWPATGSLTFFSFSPWEADFKLDAANENGLVITGWDVNGDGNQNKDLMVADVVTASTNTMNANGTGWNGVPTVFRHKLSQIVGFTVRTDKDYSNNDGKGGDTFKLNKITINNIFEKGDYKSNLEPSATELGEWYNVGKGDYADSKTSYILYENAEGESFGYNATAAEAVKIVVSPKNEDVNYTEKHLLVIPQTFAEADSPTITVSYTVTHNNGLESFSYDVATEAKLYDIHADDHKWAMNKKITYNLVISLVPGSDPDDPDAPGAQIFWAPSVENWDSESHDIIL